jgi:hypothetical protein
MTGFDERAGRYDAPGGPSPGGSPGLTAPSLSEQYDALVRDLVLRLGARPHGAPASEVETEIANLIGVLTEMPRRLALDNRVHFELACDLLAADPPCLIAARTVRSRLTTANYRAAPGFVRILAILAGNSRLSAAISALITVFLLGLAVIALMAAGHKALLRDIAATSVLMQSLHDGSVPLLIIAIHAAFLGGIVSILARIQDFLTDPAVAPPVIYVSVIRKPFLAATFVVLVFAVLKAGLVSIRGIELGGPAAPYLAWALGFLCGFTERLAEDFIDGAGEVLSVPGTSARPQRGHDENRR